MQAILYTTHCGLKMQWHPVVECIFPLYKKVFWKRARGIYIFFFIEPIIFLCALNARFTIIFLLHLLYYFKYRFVVYNMNIYRSVKKCNSKFLWRARKCITRRNRAKCYCDVWQFFDSKIYDCIYCLIFSFHTVFTIKLSRFIAGYC